MDKDKETIEDLLVEFEMARQEGRSLTAEELCVDHPHLISQVTEEIQNLMSTSWIVDSKDHSISRSSAEQLLKRVQDFASIDNAILETLSEEIRGQALGDAAAQQYLRSQLAKHEELTAYQLGVLAGEIDGPIKLDRYLILDEIGAGATGRVFKAQHLSMKRIVAIKLLNPKWDSAVRRQRFEREIEFVSKLSHPNIVTAYDACTSDDQFFLAMEFIEGPDLMEQVRQDGPLNESVALGLIANVARAMSAAHEKGIIHRDLKPSNLIRATSDQNSNLGHEVRVLDLGIARVETELLDDEAPLTSEEVPVGTVAFMSPEQAENSQSADARSDIYSLGCTLFFLLTGRVPFEGRNPVEILVKHREQDVEPLLDETAISQPTRNLLTTMLAKRPENRPHSMAWVGDQIDRILHGQVTGTNSQLHRTWAIAKFSAIGIGIASILLLAIWNFPIGPRQPPQVAGLTPFESATYQQDFAKWVTDQGGYVEALTEFGVQEFTEAGSIPAGKFKITSVDLYELSAEFSFSWMEKLPELRQIQIDSSFLNDADANYLTKLSQIKSLVLSDCELEPSVIPAIAQLTQLHSIQLSDVAISDTELEKLLSLQKLARFSFSRTTESERALASEFLNGLLEMPRLTDLNLSGVRLTSRQWRQICKSKRLTSIQVSNCGLVDEDFLDLPILPELRYLNLDFAELDSKAIEWLQRHAKLESLFVEEAGLSNTHIEKLLTLTQLKELDVSGNRISNETLGRIARQLELDLLRVAKIDLFDRPLNWIQNRPMTMLDLTNTSVSIEQLLQLEGLDIETLNLSGNGLNVDDLDEFVANNPGIGSILIGSTELDGLIVIQNP